MEINTIDDFDNYFSDEMVAIKYFANARWGEWANCPICGNEKAYFIEGGTRYKCANKSCYKKFSITSKTVFEASNLSTVKILKYMFIYTKSRGRKSHIEIGDEVGISLKTQFFISEKVDFLFSEVDRYGKSVMGIINELIKLSSNLYHKFLEIKESKYYYHPYHIKSEDINDISDSRQYFILERYTRYFIKVYAKWMFIDFASPQEILSESFLYMKEKGIKEYNGSSVLKIINRVAQKMWTDFINKHPKYHDNNRKYMKNYSEQQRINLSDNYIAFLIKSTKKYKSVPRSEIVKNKELMNNKREEVKRKRDKRGSVYEFKSHFNYV